MLEYKIVIRLSGGSSKDYSNSIIKAMTQYNQQGNKIEAPFIRGGSRCGVITLINSQNFNNCLSAGRPFRQNITRKLSRRKWLRHKRSLTIR